MALRIRSSTRGWLAAGAACLALAGAPILAQTRLLGDLEFGLGERIRTETPPHVGERTAGAAGRRPTLNFFGLPGAIATPSAFRRDVGEFTVGLSTVDGLTRGTLTFQPNAWFSGSFRYSRGTDSLVGFEDYYDRSFDLRLYLTDEDGWVPAIAVGLQDFGGTGIDAAEYVVASSTLAPGLTGSVGLGWGRLATLYDVGSAGEREPTDPLGGTLEAGNWFRGPVAPFASLEWRPTDRLGLKLEYSADDFENPRARQRFDDDGRFSFGAEYQLTRGWRIGAYSIRGQAVGFQANLAINPYRSVAPGQIDPTGPTAIQPRPPRAQAPEQWTEAWIAVPGARDQLAEGLSEAMAEEGLRLVGLRFPNAQQAVIRVENLRYDLEPQAVGRVARIASRRLPPSVETIRVVPVANGVALSEIRVPRSTLEAAEVAPGGTAALQQAVSVGPAPALAEGELLEGVWPRYTWSFRPYLRLQRFDPEAPIRFNVGLRLSGSYEPAPGWILSSSLSAPLADTIGDDTPSETLLPRVRTDTALFGRDEDIVLERLTLARYGRLGGDLYGRVTAGYLERAYGGVSAEVLWAPPESRLAFGLEANAVRKREYEMGLGFQDFDTWTAFGSAYYDLGAGYLGRVDAGRYLAGDVGATVSVDRVFENGFRVGAFATFTSASAEEFGEGSFDKGIRFTIPGSFLTGEAGSQAYSDTIRPITRDGGARLSVDGRLYDLVRPYGSASIGREFGSFLR